MGAQIKKITLKNMSAKDFSALLVKLGACEDARRWAKGKTLRKVWATCKRGDWMDWLLYMANGESGWPAPKQITPIHSRALVAYYDAPEVSKFGVTDREVQADAYRRYVKVG